MAPSNEERSLSDEATFAGRREPSGQDMSLSDERTLGGGDGPGVDTVIDDIEVVDLEARYTIEGTLGQGGMGAVLLATDRRLDRKVAIKRILGEAARSATAIQRFLTEAKAIAALNHPNIVQIYDYGRAKDGPFLIMEYVDGGSLAEKCKAGPLPLEEAIDLACQLCDGLAKAHDAGIIHRDIKPANVLLTSDGSPKLTDFGLAKAEATDHGMTMTGAVMGTPDFMPPEQRRDASEVDARSDLWSLAASIYQMLTGRSPKVIRLNDVPGTLQEVLARALEENKESRYQTAGDLRDALRMSSSLASSPELDIGTGQCPSCGVGNDASRRFCRGCGESLAAPCLGCGAAMPMWEEICGGCGAKQTPLFDDRRRDMASNQAAAERMLGDYKFAQAAAIATAIRDEPHRRLGHLREWAEKFLEKVESARVEQLQHARDAVYEASKHEAAHDYLAAVGALDMVPEGMRGTVLPGLKRTAASIRAKLEAILSEIHSLEAGIKQQLAEKQSEGLLHDVERLLELQPERADVQKLHRQLLDRQQRQAAARDEAVATARKCIDEHDYDSAVAALSRVAASMVTADVVRLRERSENLATTSKKLARRIDQAVREKALDGLLAQVEGYLQLKPADSEKRALRQSLLAREEKLAGEISALLAQSRTLEKTAKFSEGLLLLDKIPKQRHTDAIQEAREQLQAFESARATAIQSLAKACPGEYEKAGLSSDAYGEAIRRKAIADPQFEALREKVRAAAQRDAVSRRRTRLATVAAAGLATVLLLALTALGIRSAVRAWSLSRALAADRWDDALAIDPANSVAFLGRAKTRLATESPNVTGAFEDLEQAERNPTLRKEVHRVRADAFAWKAIVKARQDGVPDQAERDLAEAVRSGATGAIISSAKTAIADAWVRSAAVALAKGGADSIAALDAMWFALLNDVGVVQKALQQPEFAKIIDPFLARGLTRRDDAIEPEDSQETQVITALLRRLYDSPDLYPLAQQSVLNGSLSLLLPSGFEPMSEEVRKKMELPIRYGELETNRHSVIYSNDSGSVILEVNSRKLAEQHSSLNDLHLALERVCRDRAEGYNIFRSGIQTFGNGDWAMIEYLSKAYGMRKVKLIAVSFIGGHRIQLTFMVDEASAGEWLPVGREILQSICFVQPASQAEDVQAGEGFQTIGSGASGVISAGE